MNITNLSAITVVALVFYVGMRYCLRFLRGEIAPRIVTWLIFEIGVAMSLASYLAGRNHSLTKAALNVADCFQVTVILLVLLVKHGRRKPDFTSKEYFSLWVSAVAAAAWALTKADWVGFIGFQTVMSIAYLPTLESLWRREAGRPPEPLDKWSINVLITLIGLAVDLTGKRDYLAMIYPFRALILCLLVVGLIFRWEQKNRASVRMSGMSRRITDDVMLSEVVVFDKGVT